MGADEEEAGLLPGAPQLGPPRPLQTVGDPRSALPGGRGKDQPLHWLRGHGRPTSPPPPAPVEEGARLARRGRGRGRQGWAGWSGGAPLPPPAWRRRRSPARGSGRSRGALLLLLFLFQGNGVSPVGGGNGYLPESGRVNDGPPLPPSLGVCPEPRLLQQDPRPGAASPPLPLATRGSKVAALILPQSNEETWALHHPPPRPETPHGVRERRGLASLWFFWEYAECHSAPDYFSTPTRPFPGAGRVEGLGGGVASPESRRGERKSRGRGLPCWREGHREP